FQSGSGSAEGHETLSVRKTQAEGMLLTAVLQNGKAKVAGIGATHYDVHKEMDVKAPEDLQDANGFITPEGEFLDRKAALSWLKANRPEVYRQLDATTRKNGLESQAYAHAEGVTGDTDKAMNDFMARQFGATPGMLFQSAYHGSPHTFDKFSTSAMGTGEGAQAYGWGLYFAGNKEVAEYYRDALTKVTATGQSTDQYKIDGVLKEFGEYESRSPYYEASMGKLDDYIKSWEKWPEQHPGNEAAAKLAEKNLEKAKSLIGKKVEQVKKDGRLYHVELAPSEDEYLLWDKPLSEQSEKVRAALTQAYKNKQQEWVSYSKENPDAGLADKKYNDLAEQVARLAQAYDAINGERNNSGADTYHAMQSMFGSSHKAASEYLHSLGIRGIKYLDGTSRGKGEGNFNYVIFSDDDVSIKEMFQRKMAEDVKRGYIRFGAGRLFEIGFL